MKPFALVLIWLVLFGCSSSSFLFVHRGSTFAKGRSSSRSTTQHLLLLLFPTKRGNHHQDQNVQQWQDPAFHNVWTKHPHILAPQGAAWNNNSTKGGTNVTVSLSNVTLRSFLQHEDGFSLAMAPAFFGFYGYFGVLAAWEEHLSQQQQQSSSLDPPPSLLELVHGLVGASAGAMAAVLTAAGIAPRKAADFCSTVTLDKYADFPGWGGLFRGKWFEQLMDQFLLQEQDQQQRQFENTTSSLQLQDALVPVAVTAFCVRSRTTRVLTTGNMARAARASATFPLLFQPVRWRPTSFASHDDEQNDGSHSYRTRYLIDGGVQDRSGILALPALLESFSATRRNKGNNKTNKLERVVNLKVGSFRSSHQPSPPGPLEVSRLIVGDHNGNGNHRTQPPCRQVLSLSIQNLPPVRPWNMKPGPVAVQAAYDTMVASLDVPLFCSHFYLYDDDDDPIHNNMTLLEHYELHMDTFPFWNNESTTR